MRVIGMEILGTISHLAIIVAAFWHIGLWVLPLLLAYLAGMASRMSTRENIEILHQKAVDCMEAWHEIWGKEGDKK